MGSQLKVYSYTKKLYVPYQFICEGCHKNSGTMTAEIPVTAKKTYRYQPLGFKQQEELKKDLISAMLLTKRARIKKFQQRAKQHQYHIAFKGVCPHCKQMQSWVPVDFVTKSRLYAGLSFWISMIIFIIISETAIVAISMDYFGIIFLSGVVSFISAIVGARETLFHRPEVKNRHQPIIDWQNWK